MKQAISSALKALNSRRLGGIYARNGAEAVDKILALIPKDAVVGIGNSVTLNQIGIVQALKERGNKVHDGFERGISIELHKQRLKESISCDVFLTGTNAVTMDGRLVNVDATGNRVAGMFYGHSKSIIVVGRNKLVEDLDAAFYRIRYFIAPSHQRTRASLSGRSLKTPCATTGSCHECRSNDRICNIFTVIEAKPLDTEVHVVIVDEDLGLAWDESWPMERISNIMAGYKKFVWTPLPK